MDDRKLFKVTKVTRPEWGRDTIEFEKYFLAVSQDTVRAVVEDRYGKARYYSGDREEVVYEIEEMVLESL
jgi:hypothetical protein